MTNYIIVQAINIAILVAFGVALVLRTRAEFDRRIRELQQQKPLDIDSSAREQLKRELQLKIETLQRELEELDRSQNSATVSALRPPQSS